MIRDVVCGWSTVGVVVGFCVCLCLCVFVFVCVCNMMDDKLTTHWVPC